MVTFSKKILEVPSSLELRIFKMNSTALPRNHSILNMTRRNKTISWKMFSLRGRRPKGKERGKTSA